MQILFTLLGKLKGLGKLPARLVPERLRPGPVAGRRFLIIAGFIGCTALAFWYGRQAAPRADANQALPDLKSLNTSKGGSSGAYGSRLVAELSGSGPITREDLGEYLIARFGVERVDFLVNRRIVERECEAKGVFVTDTEVEEQLRLDIKSLGALMTEDEFVKNILKRFNKTLYEWKEDVIRPKLALTKLVKPMIKVEDADLKKAFEARYGPRVEVRLLCYPENDPTPGKIYEELKTSEEKFNHFARTQPNSHLAMTGGKVPPIHRHFSDKDIETEAFSLKEGEVSKVIQLSDKSRIILKCDRHLPADTTKTFDQVRLELYNQTYDQKLAQKIPEVFNKLREEAQPRIYLRSREAASTFDAARKGPAVVLPPVR